MICAVFGHHTHSRVLLCIFSGFYPYSLDQVKMNQALLISQTWETLDTALLGDSDGKFTGSVQVPNEIFRLLLQGTFNDTVLGEVPFQRLQPNVFTPASFEITRSPLDSPTSFLQINHEVSVNFTLANNGPATSFNLVARDTFGLVASVTPSSVTVDRNESATVAVKLFADPSLATEGSVTTLTVSANIAHPPSSNYASSMILIMPEVIDVDPPGMIMESNLLDSCYGVDESVCELFDWSATIWVNDTQTGLWSVIARNKQLGEIGPVCEGDCTHLYATFTLGEEFEEGSTDVVQGAFVATCCVAGVDFVAMDVAGNLNIKKDYREA